MEKAKREFIMSWVYYVAVCAFLTVVNYTTSSHYLWVLWVIGGWGLAQLIYTVEYLLSRSDCERENAAREQHTR